MRLQSFRTRFAGLATTVSAGFSYLMSSFQQFRADARPQSEVLGVVLLVRIVVVATSTLAIYGSAAVASNEERVAVERASNGLEQFDTRASRVAFGESDVQRMDVGVTGTSGSLDTRPNDGWIRVEVLHASNETVKREVVDQTLGALVYRSDDTTVAFQGGGVWRSDGEGSVMVSRPEFHFEDGTLTLPIVVTGGDGAVYSDVQVTQGDRVVKAFPDASRELTNKVEDVMIRITVQSDYYEAWGRYLEKETGYDVTLDHGARTATVTFDGLNVGFGRHGGIIATAGDGVVKLAGTGIYIDSYDSSEGTYTQTSASNGIIAAVNDVVSTGSSDIEGDVAGGNDVDLGGTTLVNGGAYWGDSYSQSGNSEVGRNTQISGVQTIDPIDGYVQQVVVEARTNNDNDNASVVVNDRLSGSGDMELTAGTYYLDEMSVGKGDTLVIDTTEGDVVIAVENAVSIKGVGTNPSTAATVEVKGPGTVELVVLGDGSVDFEMGKNSVVDVPEERSSQFRVYGQSDFDAELTSDNSNAQLRFEGVIYAPAGLDGSGTVTVGQAEFYGTIVSGQLTIKQNAKIHYDESLGTEWFPGRPFVSHLEYLHVSVHPIEVTSR